MAAVQQRERKARQPVEQQRPLRALHVGCRELALDLALVDTVIRHVEHQAADDETPQRRARAVADAVRPLHRSQPRRVVRSQDRRRTAGQVPGVEDAHDDTGEQHDHLDDIGPDHRAHAAHRVVDTVTPPTPTMHQASGRPVQTCTTNAAA